MKLEPEERGRRLAFSEFRRVDVVMNIDFRHIRDKVVSSLYIRSISL